MKQPESFVPLFQILHDRLLRQRPARPERHPPFDRIVRLLKRRLRAGFVHARKHGMQHCQQQAEHRYILRRQLPAQIRKRMRAEQHVAQRYLRGSTVRLQHADPRLVHKIKRRLCHTSPPFSTHRPSSLVYCRR